MVAKLCRRLNPQTQFIFLYEHLEPDPELFEYMPARVGANGYEPVEIPPTITLGSRTAENHEVISGKAEAADKSQWLSPARRDLLKERFGYWMIGPRENTES